MSIVKMKRLRLIALARDRDELLSSLLHAGCVEVSEPPADLADPLLRRDKARVAEAKSELAELKQALSVLRRQAPQRRGFSRPGRWSGREICWTMGLWPRRWRRPGR